LSYFWSLVFSTPERAAQLNIGSDGKTGQLLPKWTLRIAKEPIVGCNQNFFGNSSGADLMFSKRQSCNVG